MINFWAVKQMYEILTDMLVDTIMCCVIVCWKAKEKGKIYPTECRVPENSKER